MMVIPMLTILPTVVLHSDKIGQNLLSFACQRIEIALFKTVVQLLLVIAGLTGIYKTIPVEGCTSNNRTLNLSLVF